jgi:thiol-disulfide isomerase/thioredoxin
MDHGLTLENAFMMHVGYRLGCLALLFAGSVLNAQTSGPDAAVAVSAPASAPAYERDPKFVASLREGGVLLREKRGGFAEVAYKKANKIAGGQCKRCLDGLWHAQMMQGDYKDAAATAAALEPLQTQPTGKAWTLMLRAQAMTAQAGRKPKPQQLEAVHAVYQQVIAINPKSAGALYADGQVLARLGKLEDARAAFQQCVQCVTPHDPSRLRAEHFAENPELATHPMAPAFEVTALDGSKFNLDAMGGRVVLIDFWATWCGPCNAELPHLQRIAKEFAGQPLVIISVSWDADEAKWKEFVAKHEMTWVQYRDADHRLSDSFGINAIPHYFTIDSDGVLTAEMLGEGADVEGKLKKLVAKARAAEAAVAGASGETGLR